MASRSAISTNVLMPFSPNGISSYGANPPQNPFVLDQPWVTLALLLVEIAFAPLVHVDGEHAWIDQGAAERRIPIRLPDVLREPRAQIIPDVLRYAAGVCGVDVRKKHQ